MYWCYCWTEKFSWKLSEIETTQLCNMVVIATYLSEHYRQLIDISRSTVVSHIDDKTACVMITDSLLHVVNVKYQNQNSPFYEFIHFTLILHDSNMLWAVSVLNFILIAPNSSDIDNTILSFIFFV